MKTILRRVLHRTETDIDRKGARERQTSKRAAYAQPRVLFSATALAAGACVWWAMAAGTNTSKGTGASSSSGTSAASSSASASKNNWSDLPALMANYAALRRSGAIKTSSGVKAKRFNLTESDLTPGNNSDERDPVYSPDGNFIAFASTGADTDGNGRIDTRNADGAGATPRYHIWIMNADGSNQRQVSGLITSGIVRDSNVDQREPFFAVDGNSLVYVNRAVTTAGVPADQLFVASNLFSTPTVNQITNFPVRAVNTTRQLRSPSFSSAGAIAFSTNFDPTNGYSFPTLTQSTKAPGYELFVLTPTNGNLRRLTGPEYTTYDSQTDDLNPVFLPTNSNILFFSTNVDAETGTPRVLPVGRRIWALNISNAKVRQQVTRPIRRAKGRAVDSDDFPAFTRRFNSNGNVALTLLFQTDSFIDTSDTVNDLNIWSLAFPPTFSAVGQVIAERSGNRPGAVVESNRLSSVNGTRVASTSATPTPLFPGATEDQLADREPGGVQISTNQDANGNNTDNSTNANSNAPLSSVFASQRRSAAAPGPTPSDPGNLPVLNPDGGSFNSTHDIWTTNVEDLQPPLLVPVGSGGQLSPFFAPGAVALQAGLNAPRTPDDPNGGLQPGGIVRVAVVLQEQETGLIGGGALVRAIVRSAEPRTTDDFVSFAGDKPNEGVAVVTAKENVPSTRAAATVTLTPYDDGPLSQGGHERQNNAIRGDGIYYCQGQFTSSTTPGDFYFDLQVNDASGNNNFLYDHVWGFSTRQFVRRANSVLFVSDYAVGQTFPAALAGILLDPANSQYNASPGDPSQFFSTQGLSLSRASLPARSVESFFLENPGGFSLQQLQPNATTGSYTFRTGLPDLSSIPARDVWRILSRGAVPQATLNAYAPSTVTQLAPNLVLDANNNPDPTRPLTAARIQTLRASTPRQLASAQSFIIWASPYTGDVFAGPGTLSDPTTQTSLTNFLSVGGRLFLSGNDVAYTLSNGQVGGSNTFLQNELHANYGGELSSTNLLAANADGFRVNQINNERFIAGRVVRTTIDPPTGLRLGWWNQPPPLSNTFNDAAHNALGPQAYDIFATEDQQNVGGVDFFTSVAASNANQTVVPIYAYQSGQVGAQRIETRNRTNSFESRVVFFSFGFENINREYRARTPPVCLNYRSKITDNIRNYFITGGISGNVKDNNNTNIADFLLVITNVDTPTQVYVALTDSNGNYSLQGLPTGNYTVQPAQYTDTTVTPNVVRSFNGPYFPTAPITPIVVENGLVNSGQNFRIQLIPSGGIIGQAYGDNATPNNTGDDVRFAQNVPVLVKSVSTNLPPTPNFPSGGSYAALTQTGIDGTFTVPNLPGEITYLVIFNPIPGTFQQGGDTPDNTGIVYPSNTIKPNLNYGRRVIPVDPENRSPYPAYTGAGVQGNAINVPAGITVNLGKVAVPEGSGIPTPTPRAGPTATPIPGATPTPIPQPSSGVFVPGSLYAISFPYTDNASPTDTAALSKVFTLPPTTGTTTNYNISRYDPLTQAYVSVNTAAEPVIRGQGYFLSPNVTVRIKSPTDDPTLVPLPSTTQTFKVTLRRGTNNGLNLIGFPFNPNAYSTINWPESPVQVVNADGTSTYYANVIQAAGANVLSPTVRAYDPTTGSFSDVTALKPFGGYFATSNKDNVIVTLIARQ